ncbi:MAG: von Willebrand factor type A domain-containing protein [Candidatus Sericytochromatia bacterium]
MNPVPNPSSVSSPTPLPTSHPSAEPTALPTAMPSAGQSGEPENPLTPYRDTFFKNYGVNPFIEAGTDPLSTFALDVDTGSYSYGRNELNHNQLPPKDSVRTEEYLNAFSYYYPQPASGKFAIHTELGPSYFGSTDARLLRIGIQGKEILDRQRKDAVLTYVVDVSGSMNQTSRLDLVRQSLHYLLTQLRPSDKVGIVIYGTEARVLLEHTPVSEQALIDKAIDSLRPEGSTNVEAGLNLAYQQAGKAYQNGLVNRVILCSDGVANVGETGPDAILERIRHESENGITLTTLGFGMGEYNDTLMEQLANQGDGQYAYVDTLAEAKRLFGPDLTSTLQIIAKDAKVQVSFNSQLVEQYRLLGYENRDIADSDFRNDRIDAGEIGSGHSVTALYEVRLKPEATEGELATVFLRYKDIDDYQRIQEISRKVTLAELTSFRDATPSFKLATSVAEFAEILRQSVFAQDGKLLEVQNLALTVQTQLPQDQRVKDFVTLVQKAAQLQHPLATQSFDTLATTSQNPKQLPDWRDYLLRQLGGQAVNS